MEQRVSRCRFCVLMVLTSGVAVCAEPPAAGRLAVRETELGGWAGDVPAVKPIASRDGTHFAVSVKRGGKRVLITDGGASKPYDAISDGFAFSPDSKRLAYVAWRGDRAVAVVDGRESSEYRNVLDFTFSPDGKRFAYRARKGESWLVVVDGQEGKEYRSVSKLGFDLSGRHVVYEATQDGRGFLVIDGREIAGPVEDAVFAPDGERVALVAGKQGKHFVFLDGQPGKEYDHIRRLLFSPDGRHLALTVRRGGKCLLVLDGQEGREYDDLGDVVFSPDGKRVAYPAGKGKVPDQDEDGRPITRAAKWAAVVDGQEGKEYEAVFWWTVAFSPDGKHLAYVARQQRFLQPDRFLIVVDGQGIALRDDTPTGLPSFSFSPDSARFAYTAVEYGRRGYLFAVVVDGQRGRAYRLLGYSTEAPAFSPDSRRVAFRAGSKEGSVVVVDDQESPSYDTVLTCNEDLFAGPDLVRFAAVRGSRAVRVETTELPPP